ncbi:pentapeptide repeat-containing protein [Sphingobacterium multivorum]|uniref:pentapeptide repeat-containing protein n=1 Tax=Sphingobacterium multivorum TaxID=28454 RepID=UPI0031BB1B09
MSFKSIINIFTKEIVTKLGELESEKRKKKEEDRKEKELRLKQVAESKLQPTNRVEVKDMMFFSSEKEDNLYFVEDLKFKRYLFIRGVATNFLFKNIDFSQAIFEGCYLKDCRFINCKFEGAKFNNCNLQGSYFQLCNFDYATFEKTFVDEEIFECAPQRNNLRYKFARSLKLNYASIGDHMKASTAVNIELKATKLHLYDTWSLSDDYHRSKYGGIRRRSVQFWKWIKVCVLDFIWGNGESLWRLVRFNLFIFTFLTIYDIFKNSIRDFFDILNIFIVKVPSNYFGVTIKNTEGGDNYFSYYPQLLVLFLIILRLVSMGLLMSIIIKKYNRR